MMCRVLGVSRSGYYAWSGRPPSARSVADALLRVRIEAIHKKSDGTYGRPRIHAELKEEGMRVGAKRIARLTGEAGRSEEHTSELQSRGHLVCRLLLEKKK